MQPFESLPRRLLATAVCVTLAACSSQIKQSKSDLALLADLLPGRYTNAAQVEEQARNGRTGIPAVRLDVVRIELPLISDYAFYLQESAADNPRRILQQRLLTFEPTKEGPIVGRLYSFREPARWRDGHQNAGLFNALMFRDTQPLEGCDLLWKKEGTRFIAANSRDTCRVSSPSLGTVKVDMRAELSTEGLSLAELSYDAAGTLVQGDAAEPFYRYRRGAR